jgi:hypothetical protein
VKAEIRAGQELLKEELLDKMETHRERMMANMDSRLEILQACLGKTVAKDLEANP